MIVAAVTTFLAGVAVAVVPGWFWSRLLCSSGDLGERLACSIGLSLALVPAVALVPARLFGFGVNFQVAVASTLVVFVAGLALYLYFGGIKAADNPVLTVPRAPFGLPALVPFTLAGAAALSTMLGFVPLTITVGPVAGLVLLSGVLHVRASRVGHDEEMESRIEDAGAVSASDGSIWDRALGFALPVVILLVLLRGYLGPVMYDWPFIRGVDHYSHAVMANGMIQTGQFGEYLIYPPGFHTTVAVISQLSGLRPLEVFPYLSPAFPAICALAVYALARRLWGPECGVIAAAVCGLIQNGTHWYISDSMYPNLIAAQFLLVMTLAGIVAVYARPSVRSAVFLALLGSSVVMFHQVSSLYLAALLLLVSVFLLPYLFLRERRTALLLFSSLALMVVLSVLYVWDTYDFTAVISEALGVSEGAATGDAVGMAIGTQAPYTPDVLAGAVISQPATWLGIFGVCVMFSWPGSDRAQRAARFTILFWLLVLLAGSLTTYSGFPQRFARDLGVPLSVLAAPAILFVLRSLVSRGVAAVFVTSLATIAVAGMFGLQAFRNFEVEADPPVRFSGNYGLTINPDISAAGDWLREHNDGGNIMVSPQANQVPSRMMLAMGEYFAMQSYTEENLYYNRDLPPQGPEPLEDVLFAMYNPGDPRTRQLIDEYDVRYIVHYKYMPDRGILPFWKLAENYPDLYRPVFENEAVLIVAPVRSPGLP